MANSIKDSVREVKEEDKKVPPPAKTPPVEAEPDEEDKERRGVSYILEDGSIVEMLYDAKKRTSKLAVYKDGKVSLEDSVRIGESAVLVPFAPHQGILESGFILFPSAVGEYQSNEALYCEVRAFIDRYVKLTDKFLSVVAVYVMMSWLYDNFQTVGYIRAIGLHGTGKSRLLSVAGSLCYKALMAGGSTSTAALFRTLDLFKPTLVFDEAELGEKESVEMRQVLRQGYSAGTPVARMDKVENGKMYVKTFHVFGPKLIASQFGFHDQALESRCMTEYMYPTEDCERPTELSKSFREDALALRNKLLAFRFRNYELAGTDEALLKEVLLPRLRQTGLAVVSVAKLLGTQALGDVVGFLKEYERVLENQQTDTTEHDVLLCLLDLMKQSHIKASGKVKIGYDLAERFNQKQYEEYSDKKSSDSSSPYNVMKHQTYKVSPKKIGGYVRSMGLVVERDRTGFFIAVFKEYPKIRALAKRYRLDRLFRLPDDPMQISEIGESKPKVLDVKKSITYVHMTPTPEDTKEIFGDDENSSEPDAKDWLETSEDSPVKES